MFTHKPACELQPRDRITEQRCGDDFGLELGRELGKDFLSVCVRERGCVGAVGRELGQDLLSGEARSAVYVHACTRARMCVCDIQLTLGKQT